MPGAASASGTAPLPGPFPPCAFDTGGPGPSARRTVTTRGARGRAHATPSRTVTQGECHRPQAPSRSQPSTRGEGGHVSHLQTPRVPEHPRGHPPRPANPTGGVRPMRPNGAPAVRLRGCHGWGRASGGGQAAVLCQVLPAELTAAACACHYHLCHACGSTRGTRTPPRHTARARVAQSVCRQSTAASVQACAGDNGARRSPTRWPSPPLWSPGRSRRAGGARTPLPPLTHLTPIQP